jgi:hypothetical protein
MLVVARKYMHKKPIPVAARSQVWVYNHSLAGMAVSNPAGGMDVCLF